MIDALCYLSLGLLLVLICRKPARRAFGAGPAFTVWLLPLLLATLPWLPTVPHAWSAVPTVFVLPTAKTLMAQAAPSTFTVHWAIAIWLIGSALWMIRLAARYRQLMRQTRPLPADLARALPLDQLAIDVRRLRQHRDGPAVVWAPRSLLLLPPDFLERFDSNERLMVLRHELAHLDRGDTWWSLIAELTLALLWFHPLAWLAMPRFRLDQELACDERVLRESPMDETAYANTLLHSTGMPSMPVLIPWLAEPQLKERLTMIQQFRPGALRRQVGFTSLAALMLSCVLVAQAGTTPSNARTAERDVSYNATINPQYPADAVKNHQEGTVVLLVLVGADGKPRKFSIDPATEASPALVKAAGDAVMQWHFKPRMENGKPAEAYAKIPIKFSMHDEPNSPATTTPPAPPHASTNL
jgi:TonB family protein